MVQVRGDEHESYASVRGRGAITRQRGARRIGWSWASLPGAGGLPSGRPEPYSYGTKHDHRPSPCPELDA
ncbi:hypothetical protein E2C00_00670 [Streptomyces sp. WAC05374]|uniref:hypothetical protein n=1 Tax=Streptomyces sp. WAC05374 TaxID=2487420 RepID=UPI000F882A87|nr:hypothetical protein [Streptomyces sp. WAC05374]RST19585.1 hypothetical protein EF905_00275 [Streptomyces sp. WAC05374]TDF50078.1 hypothetical protein E2B92_00645 [Streptomyces sp. WAC05374]TDF57804.1 hypothetical protein E2C02_08435 [Streptomyces sp. WAC05374]TDF60332.1 hypothetical protein E2C00_00670 [Streptomyces sp. WAC05374]